MRIQSNKRLTSDLRHLPSDICPPTSARGFTLLELLIVISLIVVLMGLLVPAIMKVNGGAKDKRRSLEVRVIGSAIQAYKLQEKHFPAPVLDLSPPPVNALDYYYGEDSGTTSYSYGGDNSEVMTLLKNAVPPVLDVNKLRWDEGSAVDPDGTPYTITLDLNYDKRIGGAYKEYKVE